MTIFDKLPERIKYKGNYYGLELYKLKGFWYCQYFRITRNEITIFAHKSGLIKVAATLTYNQLKKENLINPL